MNTVSMILSVVFLAAVLVMIGPNVIAMNRGKALRNIALWLAIFTGLALFYRTLGPGSDHPLFSLPASMVRDGGTTGTVVDKNNNGDLGFTPPKE